MIVKKINNLNLFILNKEPVAISSWFFYYINNSIIGKISNLQATLGNSLCEIVMRKYPNLGYYFTITEAILILASVLLIVSNHPKMAVKMNLEEWEGKRWVWFLRIGTTLLIFLLPSLYWIVKG